MKKTRVGNLNIDDRFIKFIDDEAIKGTGIDRDNFWSGFDKAVHELAPINKKLLQKRDEIQKKIDEWHLLNKGNSFDGFSNSSLIKRITRCNGSRLIGKSSIELILMILSFLYPILSKVQKSYLLLSPSE